MRLNKFVIIGILLPAAVAALIIYLQNPGQKNDILPTLPAAEETDLGGLENELHPLMIEALKSGEYPGSDIVIEQELGAKPNYSQYIVSYRSDGLKIYALLTIPKGDVPANGWPGIVFNHGYIPPDEYRTTERYVAYVDYFARRGFAIFKPDLRGHGNSEGEPLGGGYYSPGYSIDVLNALASFKKYSGINPEKIGMWGHSMGGHLTTVAMIVSPDIKAALIWGGLVASYDESFQAWRDRRRRQSSSGQAQNFQRYSQAILDAHGPFAAASPFWQKVNPYNYLEGVTAPLELHHGTADATVPLEYGEIVRDKFVAAGKEAELFTYQGADHNLSGAAFGQAMARSVEFFNKHLK